MFMYAISAYLGTLVEFAIHNLDSELIDHITLVRRQVPGLLGVVDLEVESPQELFLFVTSLARNE